MRDWWSGISKPCQGLVTSSILVSRSSNVYLDSVIGNTLISKINILGSNPSRDARNEYKFNSGLEKRYLRSLISSSWWFDSITRIQQQQKGNYEYWTGSVISSNFNFDVTGSYCTCDRCCCHQQHHSPILEKFWLEFFPHVRGQRARDISRTQIRRCKEIIQNKEQARFI